MNEIPERTAASLREPGPVREKRAYNKRAPVRAEQVRADPIREEPVRTKKVRLRKNQSLNAPLEISRDILEYFGSIGIDLQWVTNTIALQPAVKERQEFAVNCWEPVTPDMFDGIFDGIYMPKGHKGEIIYDACVLMWRPMELSDEARGEEQHAANLARGVQERQMKTGRIDGINPDMLNPDHPQARANTRLTKTRERYIAQPKE